jgi:hypothetical protein
MGKVINLADRRNRKQAKEDSTKQLFKDSLDNDAVMRRYGINKQMEGIHKRIDTINNLMRELERINKGGEK